MTFRPHDKHAKTPAHWPTDQARRTNLNGGVWPNTPGLGKAIKRTHNKAVRRAAQEWIAAELTEYAPRIHARGLATSRSEIGYRNS